MGASRDQAGGGRQGGRGAGPGPLDREALGAWREVEALLAELLARSSPDEEGDEQTAEGETGDTELTASQVLARCRHRLGRVRDSAAALDRRLADLQNQQDEFLGVVAHDLRTPLVAVQGFAQLLQASGGLGEKQRTYVERILQAVRAMNCLVEDLRTARRLDQGRLALEPRSVALKPFGEELVEMHREEARQKEVDLRLEAPAGLPRAVCDPERLRQAVGNLVQNAVKFAPRGSAVLVRVWAREGVVRWEVVDRGLGFDEGLLPHFFQRWAQGGSAQSGGGQGFGLGLHICRELVALHGGRVGARNEPGGGSCFWAEIPLEGPPSTPEGEP